LLIAVRYQASTRPLEVDVDVVVVGVGDGEGVGDVLVVVVEVPVVTARLGAPDDCSRERTE